jgi:hypothetical protein
VESTSECPGNCYAIFYILQSSFALQGVTPPETPLLQRARAAGLKVYPHTFRNEVRRTTVLLSCIVSALCSCAVLQKRCMRFAMVHGLHVSLGAWTAVRNLTVRATRC